MYTIPKIKICGIKDAKLAYNAAITGAEYIGLIFYSNSKRSVDLPNAIKIADAVRKGGAKPVAVFVEQDAENMRKICTKTKINIVQLHGDIPRQQHQHLPESIQKIFVLHVDTDGNIVQPDESSLALLRPERDYILFDGLQGGAGQTINLDNIRSYMSDFNCFVAGGLNKNNISSAINQTYPYGVDVSSGVEREPGEKSEKLIQSLIETVHKGTVINTKRSKQAYYGDFGGIFMPELLLRATQELAEEYERVKTDESFKKRFTGFLEQFAGRVTPLTEVKNFQKACTGPRVFLKREDLLHTGAHKINNAIGQCLLAQRMGKKRVIAETGAGQHGVATATVCAHLNLECEIYMGEIDIQRQLPNVEKMKLLGAKVVSVNSGSKTLKDAVNEALRDYAASFEDTHYCLGSALGPYPYPQMVAYFQSVIGTETKQQCETMLGKNPDVVIACIGGGSNAIGIFSAFLDDKDVKLVGVEGGGRGSKLGEHAARFKSGRPGVLHGSFSYLLQDADGQIAKTHSISAGLDYPMIGPQHAYLYTQNRAQYTSASDEEAIEAFKLLSKTEGIIPALESSHALAYYIKHAATFDPDACVVINLSGRGDKDLPELIARGLI